ncbi:MAG: FGGY-family carbohydrate kinase [Calditrichaceae bacterium]|nr:FGGY-family carbohydrate kinase [Calditrichaceae bacterium]MBN2707955.1 FGGY-family carbohydrate kinase [Calditrichaceae bacterium]
MDVSLLAIDCGTQSIRALLFDPEGNLIASSKIPIESYFSVKPGYAEQHVHVFWQALCQACRKLLDENPSIKNSIKAIAITCQRATMVNLDKNGQPLRPAIVWLDQRRADDLPPMRGLYGAAFKTIGLKETIEYLRAESEANWIMTRQPDIWEKTNKYLFLSGYLIYRLCGEYIDSIGSQVGYVPFNYRKQQWAGPLDWKWKAIPISRKKLPKLAPVGSLLGYITKEAAELTGLPFKLPIVAAAADKACEIIGSGCLDPQTGCISYGTTATINTIRPKYIEVIPLLPPYPAAVPDYYNLEIQIYRGYWMVSWFKEEFAKEEQIQANKMGVEVEQLFDELVNSVPPGSQGLILQPYWSPGLRHPGPEAKGAVIGFSDTHTRAHLYRAILEGVAYALKEGAERIGRRSKIPITKLKIAGGGSRSDASMQLTADIFNLPATRPHTYEASGLGAAIDAAVGMGIYDTFEEAIRHMTHDGDTFYPDETSAKTYRQIYNEVYLKMYKKLRPLYQALKNIE